MEKLKLLHSIQDIHHHIVRFVELELRLRSHYNIKYSHYEIIRLLLSNKTFSMKDLSTNVMKHKSTVTALVKKLYEYNLVTYVKDKHDDRKQLIAVTNHGKNLTGLINSIEQKIMILIHKKLTVQDQNNVLEQLAKMQAGLKLQVT